MKLVTYKPAGAGPQLGVVVGERVVNLGEASGGALPNDMRSFLELGDAGMEAARAVANEENAAEFGVPVGQVKLLAPISNPSKIVAIGLELYGPCAGVGRHAAIHCHHVHEVSDVDRGAGGRDSLGSGADQQGGLRGGDGVCRGQDERATCPKRTRIEYIAGYMNCHDVSARDLQLEVGDQWIMGKSLDTFCPLGPYLVTKDEVADPHNLSIRCLVNGEALQDSNTKELVFGIPYLMAYLTRGFTLLPGDVVTTGTPHGVGAFRKPPVFLKDGDVVTVEVEGLGQLTNPCVEESGA